MKDAAPGSQTMQCGTCLEPGSFALTPKELPIQAPEGMALVDIAAVGICGTDYHIFQGKHPFLQYPRVIGHELSGYVVTDVDDFDAGDLVVINPYLSCGTCRACRRSKPNCCENISVLGVHSDGGMCQRIMLPTQNLIAAKGLDPVAAAMVEFLAIGAHAVARSDIQHGDRVLVTGAGPIGLGTALFARLSGAEVHMLDLSAARLALVKDKFGFANVHQVGAPLLVGDLADGFDIVFDATGNTEAIEAGFQYLAHGSSYVLVSVVKDDICFNDSEFHKREARIIGSRNALSADFERVMAAMAAGEIDTDALCSRKIGLSELAETFADLADNRDDLIKVIVSPNT